MKLFNKTALALAISSMTVAPVIAEDLDFSGTGETIVLADVIFGVSEGSGSEETLISAPEVTFDLDAGGTGGDTQDGTADTSTIKFTLGGGAVFGEDLSTTALVDDSNGGAGAFSLTETTDTALTYEVTQGGAVGDNTITFEITFGADGTGDGEVLQAITFGGYSVKNLTTPLNPGSSDKQVQLGVEYVEADDANDFGGAGSDQVDSTSTDDPLVIFGSQAPVDLSATNFDFDSANLEFLRINVGNGELTFTNNADADPTAAGGGDGRSDFDADGDVTLVNLGSLQLELQTANTTTFTDASGNVRKENGDDFDFQGGDTHTLNFTVASGAMQEDGVVFLHTDDSCAGGTTFSTNTLDDGELTSFALTISGTTTELTTEYFVCYQVDGTSVIPEVGQISAAWNVDFFNARYDNIAETGGNYGELLRNGCIASFFNVPAASNDDTAYIRLTNTSATNEGDIRGTLYAQDGSVVGTADTTVAGDLAVHATQVFSTEGATRTASTGEEIIDIETVFGVDGDTEYLGRARLVLKGAFDTCEGMGLMRTGDGSLFNMTATTQGNGEGADGNNGN